MASVSLHGLERATFELDGTVEDFATLPTGLTPRRTAAGIEVNLLMFELAGLRPLWLRSPVGLGYGEALWRIGVTWQGQPAWFAPVCDLDSAIIRTLGRRAVRYPVRKAELAISSERGSVRTNNGSLTVTAHDDVEHCEAVAPRPLLVTANDELFQIPWREIPSPAIVRRSVTVDDTLSMPTLGSRVNWQASALVFAGREHQCGVAQRLATPARQQTHADLR